MESNKPEDKKEIYKRIKRNEKVKSDKGNKCRYCNCNNTLLLTIDHRLPKSRGGEDSEKNLDCVCWFCNQLKGSLTPTEFRSYLTGLKKLSKLHKIKIKLEPLELVFKPYHYPDYGKELPSVESQSKT